MAEESKRKSGLTNVTFLKGEIEDIPLPDASVVRGDDIDGRFMSAFVRAQKPAAGCCGPTCCR